MQYKDIRQDTLDNLRAHDFHRKYMQASTYPNHGWHFTNMGGAEFVKRKLASYSHQEFNFPQITDTLADKIRDNKDFIGRDFVFETDEVGLPAYVLENKTQYAHLWKHT